MDILTLAIAKNKFGSANETITTENITNALGYKPANQEEMRKLSKDIADLKENGSGWTKAQIDLLDEIGNYIPFTSANGGKKWDELIASLRSGANEEPDTPTDATITRITATYTGGEVATGTALTELKGITVTATYSDGTTKTVSGYTLSGEILEGENTITVSYSGLTTTFTVVGVAESGGDSTAELITDGLLDFFDFRNCEYNNDGAVGSTLIQPTQGKGQLYAWANNCIETQDDYGLHAANNRSWLYDKNGGTNQSDLGTEFTAIFLGYNGVGFGVLNNTIAPKWAFVSKYVDTSGSVKDHRTNKGNNFNNDDKSDYNFTVYRVNGSLLTQIMDSSTVTYDGNDIENFASWVAKIEGSAAECGDDGRYATAFAVYNRALSDVEIEEMRAFFKTLEVA